MAAETGWKEFEVLLNSLIWYRTTFVETSYKTMGFLVIVVGWLVTSKSARGFLFRHPGATWAAVVFMGCNCMGYALLTNALMTRINEIECSLKRYEKWAALWKAYEIGVPLAWGFTLFNIATGGLIGLVLVVIVRSETDPDPIDSDRES